MGRRLQIHVVWFDFINHHQRIIFSHDQHFNRRNHKVRKLIVSSLCVINQAQPSSSKLLLITARNLRIEAGGKITHLQYEICMYNIVAKDLFHGHET